MYQQRIGTERMNMQENTLTNGRFTDTGYVTIYSEQLPQLSQGDLHRAANPDSVAFMADFLKKDQAGRYSWFDNLGFTLQNAGAGVLRCIHLVDHEGALLNLAIVKVTIELAGGQLELAPFTVVRPMTGEAQGAHMQGNHADDKTAPAGMEVA